MKRNVLRGVTALLFIVTLLTGTVFPASAAVDHTHTPANVVRAQDAPVDGVDLIITDIAWTNDPDNDAQVKPGTALQFTVTVKNQGKTDTPSGYQTSVDISANAKKIRTVITDDVIAAGATKTFTTTETWAPAAGDYFITAAVYNANTRAELDARNDNNDYTENLRVANDVLTAPAAALKRGYNKLTYCDDFNSLNTIDVNATGAEGYHWYVTRPWGEPDQRLDIDYSLANGILTIKTENKSAWAWSLCTIDARKTSGFAFNHGYLEYSVRLPYTSDDEEKLKSGVRNPGVWAHPADRVWADVTGVHNVRNVEVDWLEYKGTKYKGGAQFHICLHDTLDLQANDGGKQDHHATTGGKFYHEDGYVVGGDGKFHVFGWAWSEGILEYYLDGKLIHVKTYSKDGYPEPMSEGPGSEKTGIFYPLEEQYMPVVLGAVTEFRMEVEYVRVWQSDGTVKSEPIYSRLATEFLGMYMTDENGKYIRTVTDKNREQIIAASQAWRELIAEEKDEVYQALGVSYDDLLAQAQNGTVSAPGSSDTINRPQQGGADAPEDQPSSSKKEKNTDSGDGLFGLSVWLWVAIGGGVLVLIGMIVVIVILVTHRGAEEAIATETAQDMPEQTDEQPQQTTEIEGEQDPPTTE